MTQPIKARHARRNYRPLIWAATAALVVGGIILVILGLHYRVDAPLPPGDLYASVDQKPVGATGATGVTVTNTATDQDLAEADQWTTDSDSSGGGRGGRTVTMSLSDMTSNTIFIPAIGTYAPLRGTTQFGYNNAHPDMDSLLLPTNPRKVAWYSAVPLVGGDYGTTVLAGHVAYRGQWGAFHHLASLVPGNTVWTKDDHGAYQRWQVTSVTHPRQTDFPQDYWNTSGPRQLVLVTCGGPFANGHYRDNVIVVATPVAMNQPTH